MRHTTSDKGIERERGTKYTYAQTYIESCVLLQSSPHTPWNCKKDTYTRFDNFHVHFPSSARSLRHTTAFLFLWMNEMTLYRIVCHSDYFCFTHRIYVWSMRHSHTDWHSMKRIRWKKQQQQQQQKRIFRNIFSVYFLDLFAVLPTWNNQIAHQ